MDTLRPVSRRTFIAWVGGASAGFYLLGRVPGMSAPVALAQIPGGTLDPTGVRKFVTPMLVPPVMPRAGTIGNRGGKPIDYYEISMKPVPGGQQILPADYPKTPVWGYGAKAAQSKRGLLIHNAPSLTIEAGWNRPVRIKWINELVDDDGNCVPHLLPVDPTLHWANPPGGTSGRDTRPSFDGKTYVPVEEFDDPDTQYTRYTGPVPIVTHVHGAVGVADDSDGYAEAWYLPAGGGIPAGHAREGTWYEFFEGKATAAYGVDWGPGYAVFQYPNENRASTIWYHDHALGMTRLNVYAGPAGFYIVRGGPAGDKAVLDTRTEKTAILPGPAPRENDKFPPNKPYREIPIAIQDRSFEADGSLFYPDTRAFFDEIVDRYIPNGPFSPIWNPEFFGNFIMVNGSTWPFLEVERRRYRFRFLNGCQSRFLILDFTGIPGVEVWQIGNEGGFLASPVNLTAGHGNQLLMGLAERADVIVDFTNVPVGSHVLGNVGPDEPFGGLPVESPAADGTDQVLQFRVIPSTSVDDTTPPGFLQLPAIAPLPPESETRMLALIEKMGEGFDDEGQEVEGPVEALLGDVVDGKPVERLWMDPVTESPAVGATEVWELYNTTGDAHPMHIHEIAFEVVDRQGFRLDENDEIELVGEPIGPEPWETGLKDTVIAYPEQVTRVKGTFATPGQFVWHCHIVEHEDNEMMRPYRIGPVQPGEPSD
jgi:spore coat protein A, manganese oxidase